MTTRNTDKIIQEPGHGTSSKCHCCRASGSYKSVTVWLRPFAGDLSVRSVAYALSVLNALYRFLIEQRYVLANPFAGKAQK